MDNLLNNAKHPLIMTLYQSISSSDAKLKLSGARLFLACSGGRDSLALAHACYQLRREGLLDNAVTILHVHHGWQRANDDWAALVANWAAAHEFDCQILPIQLSANTETAARQARYDALTSVMADGDVLMLAHHRDDQAETVLIRLINGAGITGLAGMRSWQAKAIHDKKVWLYRPWLDVSRAEISEYACAHQLPYVDDVTNLDTAHTRGFLRRQIMPKLSQINPAALANISRTARLMADADALIHEVALPHIEHIAADTACLSLSVQTLKQLPDYMKMTILHRWLGHGETLPPNSQMVARLAALAARDDNDHGTQIFWQGVHHAYQVVAYDGMLYRYRSDVWQWLMSDEMDVAALTEKLLLPTMPNASQLKPIDNQTSVRIGKHDYRAKKLAQRLRIPVWLRSKLWLISSDGVPAYVTTLGMAWQLPSGERADTMALRAQE